MKIVAFHTPKPRQFSYKPLYYNQRKEELEELKKKYSDKKEESGISPDFREKLRASWKVREKRTGSISKITLLVYLVLAALFIYYIFFN